jgi:predicted dehydrogenase
MFQNRFTPLARQVKAALDERRLGRLLLVNLNAKWYRTADYYLAGGWRGTAAREGGAVLINQAIHSIDLLRWLCGPVAEVEGLTATTLHPIEMEDVGMALLRFESGALGSLVATTVAYPGFPDRLELHGSDGSLVLRQGEGTLEWHLRGEEPRTETAASQVSRGSQDPAATPAHGHIAQFTDFYAAIREDRPPFVDGREGRHALELVEAIYRSSRQRRPVGLPL